MKNRTIISIGTILMLVSAGFHFLEYKYPFRIGLIKGKVISKVEAEKCHGEEYGQIARVEIILKDDLPAITEVRHLANNLHINQTSTFVFIGSKKELDYPWTFRDYNPDYDFDILLSLLSFQNLWFGVWIMCLFIKWGMPLLASILITIGVKKLGLTKPK